MHPVICSTTLVNGNTLEITQDPSDAMCTLDCGWLGNGFKQFIELPRRYKTVRGARQAAVLLAGETLTWTEPTVSIRSHAQCKQSLVKTAATMSKDQQTEWNEIKAKTEDVRLAFDRLEDRAGIVRVCLDPDTACRDQLALARLRLAEGCRELMTRIEALEHHGQA